MTTDNIYRVKEIETLMKESPSDDVVITDDGLMVSHDGLTTEVVAELARLGVKIEEADHAFCG